MYCDSDKFRFYNTKLASNDKFIFWFNNRFGVNLNETSNIGERYQIVHRKMSFNYLYAIYKNVVS